MQHFKGSLEMAAKTYKIERRLINIAKWWQFSNVQPRWCLVEYGKEYIHDMHGMRTIDYDWVLLQSDDLNFIQSEFINFTYKDEQYTKTVQG